MSKPTAIITGIVLSILVFFVSFFTVLYDENFYSDEFARNNVDVENRQDMVKDLLNYFRGSDSVSKDYFNEKEIQHLKDVKGLINAALWISSILSFALAVLFITSFRREVNFSAYLRRSLTYTALGILGFSVVAFLFRNNFSYLFIKFHEILFKNDLWLLNPNTDILIVLFPQQFFMDFVVIMFSRALLISLILLALAFLLNFKKKLM